MRNDLKATSRLLSKLALLSLGAIIIWFAVIGVRVTLDPPAVGGPSADPADLPISVVVQRMHPEQLRKLPLADRRFWPVVRAELNRRRQLAADTRPQTMADMVKAPR